MFSFTKRPERFLDFNGQKLELDLSFNNVIASYSIIENKELSDEERINQAFKRLFNDKGATFDMSLKGEMVNSIFTYLSKRPYDFESIGNADGGEQEPVIDFEQDAGAIYASFMEQYGIDLNKELGRMHWDTFIALFDNLNGDTAINRIVGYRQDDLSGYEDDQKGLAHASEMKEYYKLDKVREMEKENMGKMSGNAQSIFDSLFNQK